MPVIAVLTDFGTRDHYVGTMKGVVLGICANATLVDISHEIPPQDVFGGAMELAAAAPYFPASTVFLCVVDPGVGSSRRAVAVRSGDHTFVGPDNGLLSLAVGERFDAAAEIINPKYLRPVISHTFEGRDRFAPAAAWLASGVAVEALGPSMAAIERITVPAPRVSDEAIDGEVVRVDRFGNLITNIASAALPRFRSSFRASIAGHTITDLASTYAQIPAGEPGALVGSTGHLEIAANGGNAAQILHCGRGTPVHVSRGA